MMPRFLRARAWILVGLLLVAAARSAAAQWPPDSFTNLKVLPKDIPQRQLIDLMISFTRALGVRCTYCHVGEEGRPLATYRFPADDKLPKRKARVMLRMVRDINGQYLTKLERRMDPPIRVECATCHRGAQEPRMLQDVLLLAYAAGGLDSALNTYHALRATYYGRFAYDFGPQPLSEAARSLWDRGHPADAVRLFELNVEMNPDVHRVKMEHAVYALTLAFQQDGLAPGTETYHRLSERYGPTVFTEALLNQVGYRLLNGGQVDEAIGVFRLNVEAFPASANVYDSLGEAYMKHGDRQQAIDNYEKSLEIDPSNANAKRKLETLRGG